MDWDLIITSNSNSNIATAAAQPPSPTWAQQMARQYSGSAGLLPLKLW
jgi:hypothetical protein